MAAAVATKFSHKLFEPAPMNITETNHCLVIFEKLKIQREQVSTITIICKILLLLLININYIIIIIIIIIIIALCAGQVL